MSTVEVEQALGMEPATRGAALLALREDQWFDRKSARILPRALADAAVGMANAEGGTIVVGLSNGVVEGIDRHRSQLNGWQQSTMDFTVPRVPAAARLVDCVDTRGEPDRLFVLDIDASEVVHANQRDEVFLRVGDENRKLSFDQRRELMFDKGQATYETTVVPDAIPEEIDVSLLDSYSSAVRHTDPLRLLQARGLVTRHRALTVGALVLFGLEPQARYPEAIVRVLRYRGIERGTGSRQQLLDDLRCDGPIPRLLFNAQQAISERVPSRRALGSDGRFEQIGIVPRDAWMEALVNAVVHRSYSMMGDHIRVEIFDDRIEIESPGRFPGLVDPTDPLAVTRFARNPRIARVCADLRFGEELGEGIRRMFEEMRLAGLADPIYHQTSGSVRVTLLSTPVNRSLEARLPRGARDLARYVREAGRISTGELVETSGLSRPVVIRRLKALEEAGVVQWVGNSPQDPRAYWKLRVH